MERLNKVLADRGIASRRKCDLIIQEGRVKVNGVTVTELGTKVGTDDRVTVDGKPLLSVELHYFLMNKPTGVLSAVSDDKGRKTVIDLLEQRHRDLRLFPVGRLDYNTAGLIILTNDGELANRLSHPSFEVEKTYLTRVSGIVIKEKIRTLRKGITLEDGHLARPQDVRLVELDKTHQSTLISITLTEGRNREVRKIMEAIGHPVKKLTRIRYDFLTLEGIERGTYRPLKIHEVKKLYAHQSSKNT
ncbi:MAG: rRNA pseudouridine synthase [Acholeplasmataceae bacterium]|nr:rRNA pseudouridine synthase [Acholeplasmataceae bacterium]